MTILFGILLAAIFGLWILGERGRLLRRSTWATLRGKGINFWLHSSLLHGYVFSRWTNQYFRVLIHWFYPLLGKNKGTWLSDRYHGKVLTPELAEAMICLDHDISSRDLEQIIPYPFARELLLSGPSEVAVYECGCRHARKNPCQPTQVCMIVGQPGVDFVLDHNPHSSRRLTQEEALALLNAEHKRGHLHAAWFKDVCLNRCYAICNCCKCCCAGVEGMMQYGVPTMASSGYVAMVNEALCECCGICAKKCPFEAIQINQYASVNWDACMGCGICEGQCPQRAIALGRDEKKGVPLDVRLMVD